MSIEAERDMVPTCWSCAILNDDPSQSMPPAGLYDPDDPRLLIGDVFGGSNGVTRYLQENDLELWWIDRLPNDYQFQAIVNLASEVNIKRIGCKSRSASHDLQASGR